MNKTPPFTDWVLDDLAAWRRAGLRTALVTLVGVEGTSPRPLGSQMAVGHDPLSDPSEAGRRLEAGAARSVGLISGGCVEAAIRSEARAAIEEGRPRMIRYGTGSPYLDIRLPCGSGIDVFIDPALDDAALEAVIRARAARQPFTLSFALGADGSLFHRPYWPTTRLVLAGRGPLVEALAAMASAAGIEVHAFSPDTDVIERIGEVCARAKAVTPSWRPEPGLLDRWSAMALAFHDHEWEPPLLEAALASPAFYIGALGSRRTHAARCDILRASGWQADDIAKIHGPIGLEIGARTPPEIAVAILAQMIAARKSAQEPDQPQSAMPEAGTTKSAALVHP